MQHSRWRILISNADKPADKPGATPSATPEQDLASRLNMETGLLAWDELIRFFARGVVVKVDMSLDLVEVAEQVVRDNTAIVGGWLESGLVSRATDDDARLWNQHSPDFWCLVAAPWVLVQENTEQQTKH